MKKFLFCILILEFGIFSFSQSSLPKNVSDSLWGVWEDDTKQDTIRLSAMNKFVREGYLFSHPDSADHYAQIQFNFAEKAGLKKEMAQALSTQGISTYLLNNYEKALWCYSSAMKLWEEIDNDQGVATALLNIGLVYYAQADYPGAIDHYSQSLIIYTEIDDNIGIAKVLNNLGLIYSSIGDYEAALENYNRSLQIMKTLNDQKSIGASLNNIASIYSAYGDYDLSIAYYEESIKIYEQRGDQRGILSPLLGLGGAYWLKSDYTKSFNYFSNAISLCETANDKTGKAKALTNMGVLLLELGDYEKAKYNFEQALDINISINAKNGVAINYDNLGTTCVHLGDYEQALQYHLQSLQIQKEIGNKMGLAKTLNNLGGVYLNDEDYVNSFDSYFKAMEIFQEIGDKKGILVALYSLSFYHLTEGTAELAKGNKISGEEKINQSLDYSINGYDLAENIGALKDLLKFSIVRYLANISLKQLDEARKYVSEIIRLRFRDLQLNYFSLSEREKELYFATMEKDFGFYNDFTVFSHSKYPLLADTAFTIALQNKGITLKSSTALRVSIHNSGDSLLMSEYEKWLALKKKISGMNSKGTDTKNLVLKADELEKELINKSDAFSDFNKIQTLNWTQVRDGLKEGEAAIEFVHFKSEIDTTNPTIYAAFVVRPNSLHPDVVKLCTEEDLKNILGVFQGNNLNFIEKVYGKKAEAKKDLYEKIWFPLEPYLQDVKTVYYSPSGLLHKVSFAAICKEQDVFLSDVYNFRQMGSTGNLAFDNKTEFGGLENFLLMGGVNYNSDSTEKKIWDYLPGSLAETNAINKFLQKKKYGVNYFHSNNASESIFKEKITSSSIVHIATHGFFFPDPEQVRAEMRDENQTDSGDIKFRGNTNYVNWSFVNNKNPLMRSGIVLANANDVWQRNPLAEGEDGILTAQEVSNLDLRNTKLVVLSACETGLGDIKGSEGVFGLQRAFKMAGVKYLIMSLWQVPDKETSEFMQLFYKNLLKIKDIPTAFQKTQKVMREKYDPYYWGAFVLIE